MIWVLTLWLLDQLNHLKKSLNINMWIRIEILTMYKWECLDRTSLTTLSSLKPVNGIMFKCPLHYSKYSLKYYTCRTLSNYKKIQILWIEITYYLIWIINYCKWQWKFADVGHMNMKKKMYVLWVFLNSYQPCGNTVRGHLGWKVSAPRTSNKRNTIVWYNP